LDRLENLKNITADADRIEVVKG